MRRRHFLRVFGLAVPAAPALIDIEQTSQHQETLKELPVVISTWAPNKKANEAAWKILSAGGNALDAVHAGVMVPEADPEDQSVGYGGLPDRDGRVTLDACIMDHQANIGAVMCLEFIKHPVSVARLVMEKTPHVQLVGAGALAFALANGFKKEELLTKESRRNWKSWLAESKYNPLQSMENIQERIKKNHDTIGMLAIDHAGNISGACSTSGMAYKMHGRVGDSPIIGAGLFVDNEVGAATASGVGEDIVRICGSHTIVEAMRHGMSPQQACEAAVKRLVKVRPATALPDIQAGFIAINKKGEYGCYSLQKEFTMAVRTQARSQVIEAPYYLK